jgi:hypothetical protein
LSRYAYVMAGAVPTEYRVVPPMGPETPGR